MTDELTMLHRGQAVRGLVHEVDDTGAEQRLVVETHAGNVRDAVVHQPFGFASSAPADGAITLVMAAGGDQGDAVALPPSNPQAARFGNLPEGDAVLYDLAGQRVHLSGGRIVAVYAAATLDITVGGVLAMQLTSNSCTINVDLVLNGKLTATGDVVAGKVSLQNHLTSGVQPGGGRSGPPVAG